MRLTRWSLALHPYTFEIQHRKGQDNARATEQCFALDKEKSNVTDNIHRGSGSGQASGSLNQERSGPITRQEREFQSGPVIPSDPGQHYIKN